MKPSILKKQSIDFATARLKHWLWNHKLSDFLLRDEKIGVDDLVSEYHCDLGKWLYDKGLREYNHLPEIHDLEFTHTCFHDKVKEIVCKKLAGQEVDAKEELAQLHRFSQKMVHLLQVLEEAEKV